MKHFFINTTLAIGLLPGIAAHPAAAQTPVSAFTISGGLEQTATDYGDTSYSLGYAFTANSALHLNALGFYDDGTAATHMQQNHAVGIFDTSGCLLVQTTVTPTDPSSNLFRYDSTLNDGQGKALTSFTLLAGRTYVTAAVTGADEFVNVGPSFGGSFSADPSVTFVEDRTFAANADGTGSHNSSALAFPEFSNHNDYFGDGSTDYGYFGPNLQFTPAVAPEPPTLAVFGLAAAGILGLTLRRRTRS